jgi:hypothetical protein
MFEQMFEHLFAAAARRVISCCRQKKSRKGSWRGKIALLEQTDQLERRMQIDALERIAEVRVRQIGDAAETVI